VISVRQNHPPVPDRHLIDIWIAKSDHGQIMACRPCPILPILLLRNNTVSRIPTCRLPASVLALLIALVVQIAPRAGAAEPKKLVTLEGITQYELDNGLQVLLYPDESRPTVTVNLTVYVGSRHEGYGETGMAHLLEHMLFKGTPTHKNIPKLLTEKGARFNGTTSLDRTNYYETLPASDENLEFAIKLESDRMVNSYIKGEDLASEMTVVRNEFERGENSPSRILRQRMMASAFEWHNYGKSTIGNRSDIERVPLPRLRAFYRKYYQPDNAILVVAGQFDVARALALISEYFGAIPRPERELDKTYTDEPAQDGERSVTLRRVGDVAMAGLVYHVPAAAHPDFAAVDVLSYILAIEPAGRLYKALVETKIASTIVGGTYSLHDPGIMVFYSQAVEKDNVTQVRDVMIAEIEKIGEEGVSDEEVQRVIQQIKKQREQTITNTSRVAIQLSEWASQGDWRLFFLYRDRVEKVTAEDVQRVAKQYMRPSNRTVGLFIPTKEPQQVKIPYTPDIAEMVEDYEGRETIAQGEKFDPSLEHIKKRTTLSTLNDGIQVALLPKKSSGEMIVLSLQLNFGNLDNLKDLDVASGFLGSLMMRGTEQMDHQQIQDALDNLEASVSGSSGVGSLGFSVKVKKKNLAATLAILKQVIQTPTFPEKEFEVMRQEQLTQLESMQSDPQALAVNLIRRKLFPYDQGDLRANHTIAQQIEELKAVKMSDIRKLYDEFITNTSGELVVVGEIDPKSIQQTVESLLEGMSASQTYTRIPRQSFLKVPGSHEKINTPDKKNSMYLAAMQIPVGRLHPDYPALVVGNHILGGGSLSSRLADRVRQKDGLSYGIASMYSSYPREELSRVMIYAISNPENSPKVVKAIDEELKLLLKEGVTEDELAQAKQSILQGNLVSRSSDDGLLSIWGSLLASKRDIQTTRDLELSIESLTVDQVNTAMRKYVKPEKLIIVTAGDFKE
jgi:zinc protease